MSQLQHSVIVAASTGVLWVFCQQLQGCVEHQLSEGGNETQPVDAAKIYRFAARMTLHRNCCHELCMPGVCTYANTRRLCNFPAFSLLRSHIDLEGINAL